MDKAEVTSNWKLSAPDIDGVRILAIDVETREFMQAYVWPEDIDTAEHLHQTIQRTLSCVRKDANAQSDHHAWRAKVAQDIAEDVTAVWVAEWFADINKEK